MKNLLIGSRALNFWHPAHQIKLDTDWDIISLKPIAGAEWHDPSLLNNSELERYASDSTIQFAGETIHIVNEVGLLITKRSHLWRELGFDKHITQYHQWLSKCANNYYAHNLSSSDIEFLQHRTELSYAEFPTHTIKLNVSVRDFFADGVKKVYDHDYLHRLFAYGDVPHYTRMQIDDSKAWCERRLWEKFTFEEQVETVAEECYVIAAERFLIPANWQFIPRIAYYRALKKVCTTLTSGWFRDFAIDYFPLVLEKFSNKKFQDVQKQLKMC